jgi:hypothetical protein
MQLLVSLLTPFIPLATPWAKEQEAVILAKGRALTPTQVADAIKAGVVFWLSRQTACFA